MNLLLESPPMKKDLLIALGLLIGAALCAPAAEQALATASRQSINPANLFDDQGLPKPFSKAPRLTVYKRELYDYAECINLATILHGRFQELDRILSLVLADVFNRWQKRDGSFRARELMIGWDNVPMHRWAQSQLFRSLCLLLKQRSAKSSYQNSYHALQQQLLQQTLQSTTTT